MNIGRKFYFDGDWRYLSEISRMSGVNRQTINGRLERGMSLAAAIAYRSGATLYTFDGKAKTLAQWADEVGLKYDTLRDRVRLHGWSLERALTQPPIRLRDASHNRRIISEITHRFRSVRNRLLIHRITTAFHANTGGYDQISPYSRGTGVGRRAHDLHQEKIA